jgi:hypothetical protein
MKLTIEVESNTERADLYPKLLQSTDAVNARLEHAIEDALTSERQGHVGQEVTRPAFMAAVTGDGAD